jgi:hypothetical protein
MPNEALRLTSQGFAVSLAASAVSGGPSALRIDYEGTTLLEVVQS